MTAFVLILSSPSGGGKTTVAKALLSARDDVAYSVSATTRGPRTGEQDGVDYRFVSREEFGRWREAGRFLEWAEYGGELYGTLTEDVDRILAGGRHALLDIEIQGARQIRQRRDDVVSIFMLPPSANALWERLGGRSSEESDQLRRRIERAAEEVQAAAEYDFIVVNDDRAQALAEVAAIIEAEARRTTRLPELKDIITSLRRELTELAARVAAHEE